MTEATRTNSLRPEYGLYRCRERKQGIVLTRRHHQLNASSPLGRGRGDRKTDDGEAAQ